MTKKTLLLAVALISQLFLSSLFAQTRYSVSVGAANPLSSFGSDDASDVYSNYAALGAVFGVKMSHQFQESKFGLYGSFDLIYNGLSKQRIEQLDELYSVFGVANKYNLYERHLNFPIAFGVTFRHDINENVSLMGNAGLAYNFSRITDGGVRLGSDYYYRTQYGWSGGAGYKVGGGFLFNDKFSLSFDYYNLGENSFSLKTLLTTSNYLIKNTRVASLSLGFWF